MPLRPVFDRIEHQAFDPDDQDDQRDNDGEHSKLSDVSLCYRHSNQIPVVIEPGASLIHARMRAALANLDESEFTEGGRRHHQFLLNAFDSQQVIGPIHKAARGAASRDYVFDGREL